jgi:hypothetical protein
MSQSPSLDYTVRVFDQFYDLDLVVNADEYEVVRSFFTGFTSNEKIARSFTDTIFRISSITQISVMDLLQTFDKSDKLKVSLTMAYYLNSISNKAVLYGVNQVRTPVQSVARNVVQ